MTADGYDAVRAALVEQIAAIAASSDATNPKDLHHYLYFHVGVFGWLMAPGYFKEPVREARRPLASRQLLHAAAGWTGAIRHDKRVVAEVLRHRTRTCTPCPWPTTPR